MASDHLADVDDDIVIRLTVTAAAQQNSQRELSTEHGENALRVRGSEVDLGRVLAEAVQTDDKDGVRCVAIQDERKEAGNEAALQENRLDFNFELLRLGVLLRLDHKVPNHRTQQRDGLLQYGGVVRVHKVLDNVYDTDVTQLDDKLLRVAAHRRKQVEQLVHHPKPTFTTCTFTSTLRFF